MKNIINFLLGVLMSITLTSCVTSVQASDGLYGGEVDATIIISYGTPFIVNDMIEYYLYKGWYYYPYRSGDRYYFHRYRRVLPRESFRNWYRPIPRSYYYPKPHHVTPHHNGGFHNRPNINRPPHVNRGNVGGNRPSMPQRSSTRNGHFGGRR